MITTRLMGGMGNQMFQAAYALALKDRGYQVQLDRSKLIEGTHREYSLARFGFEATNEPTGVEVYEGSLRFNPAHLSPPDGSTMIGYWQSEKYFQTIESEVRTKFNLGGQSTDAISLHVRRQDYVTLENFHGMPDVHYYREAVRHIRQTVGRLVDVLVFSDDTYWCKENFPDFTVVDNKDKYANLQMMASCDYAITANSSYSWWGAYLGPQRLVVAPKQWFVTPDIDSADIVPQRWVRL